jgi:hypothetical protein
VFSFRNAGLVGDDECDRAPGGVKRLQRDVLDLKPTWVCIAFGMNDPRYRAFDQAHYDEFVGSLKTLVHELKQRNVQVVLMTPGGVEPGFLRNGIDGKIYNDVLRRYAQGVKSLASAEKLPVADVQELVAGIAAGASAAKPPVSLAANPTQPAPLIHAAMAFTLLRALGCEGPIADAVLEARSGRISRQANCRISDFRATPDSITFVRSDNAVPAGVDPESQAVYSEVPAAAELNRYGLTVKGLAEGKWHLAVEGKALGDFSAAQLAAGIDLRDAPGPWREVAANINAKCAEIEELYNHCWWDVVTATNWWLPEEADAERRVLLSRVLELLSDRDRQLSRIAAEHRPWKWTLTRQAGGASP